ncbi:MAG TPA: hypothetical protein VKW04_01555 [Planctomycetota bacterium]|nr:hypothetical protein [Planctomycetota bacterium]
MGQEILYCLGCRNQLRSSDFEKRKAFKISGLEAVCSSCAPRSLRELPEEKAAALKAAMEAAPPTPSSTSKSGTARIPVSTSTPKSGTGRVPLAQPPPPARAPQEPDGGSLKMILIILAGAALATGMGLLLSSRPPTLEPSRTSDGSSPSAGAQAPSSASQPESAQDRIARESFRQATLYADAYPAEIEEQLRRFEKAAGDARNTGFQSSVDRVVDTVRRKVKDLADEKLRLADLGVNEAVAKEEFKRAAGLLDEAARRPVGNEWAAEIENRRRDLRRRLETSFARLRVQALQAPPGSGEVRAIRERIAAWDSGALLADLDQALAEAAAPKPAAPAPLAPAPPAVPPASGATPAPAPALAGSAAYPACWSSALTLASGRDFAPAVEGLERAAAVLQDPGEKTQAAQDLELLKSVQALHAEAFQALARWPAGKKISIGVVDFDNRSLRVEGPFVRLRPGVIDIQKGRALSSWPLGHLTARTIADLVPGRAKAAAAAACLLEGDVKGAKEVAAGETASSIPARWWTWGEQAAQPADPEQNKREGGARYGYYFAMIDQGSPALRADAALKCRKILEESGSLTWVCRNRALLTAVAETTREYLAGPASLRPAGTFRLEVPKGLPYLMSSADADPARRRENYVEMDFSVLTDQTYHAWAYIGACCSESLVFYSQTTDLARAEPGSEPDQPVKHAITSATKTHAGHSGRKAPTRWGWVEIPLPKYEKPGSKVLRLVSAQQGFAVAWIVVSSLRDRAPTEVDMKDWERELPHAVGPAGPTLSLAAWFRADAGVVPEAGHVGVWQDQSGHNRHAVQATPAGRPTLAIGAVAGKPAIRFDGMGNSLSFDCPVNGQTGLTVFLVAAPSKNQLNHELGNFAPLQWGEFGPWGGVFLSPQQSGVAWRCGTSQWGNISTWPRPATVGGATVTVIRKDADREDLFVGGALVLSAKDKQPVLAHTVDVATIGAGTDSRQNPLRFFLGDIAEILVFTRALADPERDAVERYLRGKYGL